MRKLHTFSFWQRPLAGMFRERLATEGVACLIRNEQLSSAIGEIPFTECYPELWVIDEETYPRARLLLDNWLSERTSPAESWRCRSCDEISEEQFGACWSCGEVRE